MKKVVLFLILICCLTFVVQAKTIEYDEKLEYTDFNIDSELCYSFDQKYFYCENGWIEYYGGYKIVHMVQIQEWYYSENIALHRNAEIWVNRWNNVVYKIVGAIK